MYVIHINGAAATSLTAPENSHHVWADREISSGAGCPIS